MFGLKYHHTRSQAERSPIAPEFCSVYQKLEASLRQGRMGRRQQAVSWPVLEEAGDVNSEAVNKGWRCSSLAEHERSVHEALGSSPSQPQPQQEKDYFRGYG